MKKIKNFNSFKNEYNQLDEGKLKDGFNNAKKIIKKIGEKIYNNVIGIWDSLKEKYGKHTWAAYNEQIAEDGLLPKGVEYFSFNTGSSNESLLTEINQAEILGDNVGLGHTTVEDVDSSELIEMIKIVYNARRNDTELMSLYIWGAPGIGKTEIVVQASKELQCDIIIMHLAHMDTGDFRGLPIILDVELTDKQKADAKKEIEDIHGGTIKFKNTSKEKRAGVALPIVFPSTNRENGNGGILFLDEMNRAEGPILSAALPLTLDGKWEGYELPSRWIVVAAGNREEDVSYNVDLAEITGALGNRFMHLNFKPDVESWLKWANTKEYIDNDLKSFLQFDEEKGQREWFHKLSVNDKVSAWPSPRSWSKASWLIWSAGNHDFAKVSSRIKKIIYSGIVGPDAAQEFKNYIDLISIVSEKDIEDIYKKGIVPKGMKGIREDIFYAISIAISNFYSSRKLTPTELENIFEFAMKLGPFEKVSAFMAHIRAAHTKDGHYYIEEDAGLSEIYFKYVEMWVEMYEEVREGSGFKQGDGGY